MVIKMKIEIDTHHTKGGLEYYSWSLYTGPDGIDHYEGEANSLGECFEQIIRKEYYNALGYR